MFSILLALSLAQCPYGTDAQGRCLPPPQVTHSYAWSELATDEFALHDNGRWVGNYRTADGFYFKGPTGEFVKGPCPTELPVTCKDWRICGVERQEIEKYNASVSAGEFQALVKEDMTDRSKQPRVTILVTNPEDKKALTKEAKSGPLAEIGQIARLRIDTLDDPIIKDAGFKGKGDKTLLIQDPRGKVVHNALYTTPEAAVETVRKIDPKYDPSKDPDLNGSGILDFLKNLNLPPWLIAGIALLLAFKFKKEPASGH